MNTKPTTDEGERDRTVQLLVSHEANAEAMATLLEERFDVKTNDAQFVGDLYIVDDRSLPQYRERLETLKNGTEPTFTPVVLVRREGTQLSMPSVDHPDSDEQPLIDEVIGAPVRKATLFRRLSNLFVRRDQFRTLAEQNDRLDEFASVVSHDLRNPLQVAKGRLELLEPSISDDDLEHFEAIEESLERMDSLIDNVLEVSREGMVTDDVTTTDVQSVVEEAWASVNSADATLIEPDEPASVTADADQLLTVFENLFRNAIEHGGDSGTVEVGLYESGFYVADDGPGIPPNERENVLKRGYSTSSSGTGLGLDIVTNVVDAHGWTIGITESERGGARFEINGVERADHPS